MNKISKKILAIVTMAAFVVTMMPFAAFAAPVEPDNSYILTANENEEVAVNDPVSLELEWKDISGAAADASELYLWVENEDEDVSRAATFTYNNGADTIGRTALDNGYAAVIGKASDARKDLQVKIAEAGTYTIHAGVNIGNYDNPTRSQLVELQTDEGYNTIEVYAEDAEVTGISVSKVEGTNIGALTPGKEDNTATVEMETFAANGVAKATVTGSVKTSAGSAADQVVALSTNKSTLKLSDSEVTTDRNGNFEFTFTVSKKTDYKIYLETADQKYTLNLNYDEDGAKVDDIVTSVNNDAILEAENADVDFSDAVQFVITDENGNELDGTISEPAEEPDTDYVGIVSKPDRSRLEAGDIALYYNTTKDVWTLDYKGDADTAKRDLIAGEYTVSIAVSSGESTEATFTLAEAGDPVGITFELTGDKTDGILEDTVINDENVTGTVYYVDANGIKTELDAYNSSVQGDAVATSPAVNGLSFTVDAGDDDQYMGSVITVTVLEPVHGFMTSQELTVIDGKTTNTLAFDSETGAANTDNTVKVTLVDENGDLVKNVDGAMHAYISDQSNEDANVEVSVVDDKMDNGKGTLTIFSDKETTVDIVVAVVDEVAENNANNVIYAATLEYTIGEEDVNADTIVAMTIGSSDVIVNNDIVSTDAAPFVDDNWRTMVPVRALSEAFGGSAEWDGDARTVTVVNGDTTIVFDADSANYTVNGEEKTMDTELTIVDGRTYVPVRFVADELGYQITVLKDAQGLTASVVFQK